MKKKDKVTDGKTLECFWMRWLWQNHVRIRLNGGGTEYNEWTRGCAFDLFVGHAGITTKILRNAVTNKAMKIKNYDKIVLSQRVCCR